MRSPFNLFMGAAVAEPVGLLLVLPVLGVVAVIIAMTTSSSSSVNALPLELPLGSPSEVMAICIFLFSGKLDRPRTVNPRQETVHVGCCSFIHNDFLYRKSHLRVVLLQLFAVERVPHNV
jgi:hypothetical protein